MKKEWTDNQIEFLKENYDKMTYRELGKILDRSRGAIQTKVSRLGLIKDNSSKIRYDYNKKFFKSIDTEEKAYWLGFLYADGSISQKNGSKRLELGLAKVDYSHLVKFNNSLMSNIKIKEFNSSIGDKKYPSCKLTINSTEICNDLINHDLVQNKTYMKQFPKLENNILFCHFLRGFLDGDGNIYYNDNFSNRNFRVAVEFTSYNSGFLFYIKDRLLEFGISSYVYKQNNIKKLSIHNFDHVYNLLSVLYINSHIYLDRKFNKSIEVINAYHDRNNMM